MGKFLSPFRYPGGKSWLASAVVEEIGKFEIDKVIEPFAGGASVGLACAQAGYEVVFSEIDLDVISVWATIFHGSSQDFKRLCANIRAFRPTLENVQSVLGRPGRDPFKTIVKNRMNRAGILAPGASLMKAGENGKGLASRWYPETLVTRLKECRALREKIEFMHSDAFQVLVKEDSPTSFSFIDPPYSMKGGAGRRLYSNFEIDHERLFRMVSNLQGRFWMTYDMSQPVLDLAKKFKFTVTPVAMRTAHNQHKNEVIISK